MQNKRIFSSFVFFLIGVTLFWFVYRDFDFTELKSTLKDIRYGWVILSIGFGMVSHYFRALRWKLIITPIGHEPRLINLYLSVIVLYFTNLIIPRGGELARCAVITRYEGIHFIKLTGTVLVERIVDLLMFLLIFLVLIIGQFQFFNTIFNYPEFKFDFSSINNKYIPILVSIFSTGILILVLGRVGVFKKIRGKLKKARNDFIEGTSAIAHMEGRILFLVYTLLIFFSWFLMLYMMFFAYPATINLSFMAAILTYTLANLAYLLPIQAGIGTWHFIVISCLFFYGIDKETGMIFALIAHTFTNLIYLALGPLALSMLPVINSVKEKKKQV